MVKPNKMDENSKILEVAKEAAKKGGEILLRYFGEDIQFDKKEDASFVSIADKESESVIKEIILRNFPQHRIIGEESGITGTGEVSWHIDPLDGTSNFKEGIPFFCVSIGIEKNREFIIGVVYNPLTNELYSALKDYGTFLNGKRIIVNQKKINDGIVIIDASFKEPLGQIKIKLQEEIISLTQRLRIIGSCALQLAGISRGTFISSISDNIKSYDFAAGVVLVREAGGIVTDQFGNKLTPESKVVIASNNIENHKNIIKIVRELYAEYK